METIEKILDNAITGKDYNKNQHVLSPNQFERFQRFSKRVNKFSANFAFFDTEGELVLLSETGELKTDVGALKELSLRVLAANCDDSFGRVYCESEASRTVLSVVLKSSHSPVGTALIDFCNNTYTNHIDIREVFSEMLELLAENFSISFRTDKQIEKITGELSEVYEELVLLYKLSSNMKVIEQDSNFLQMACDSLTDIVSVEGIAILLKKRIDGENQMVVAAGSGLIDIDERMKVILYSRVEKELNRGKEALLDSEVDTPFIYEWSDNIDSIIAVPLYGKKKAGAKPADNPENSNSIIGLMVAVNRIAKPDFDSIDLKLFNSVANSCAVFVENSRLFGDLKELFIGSLKALTSSIDAKDQYTHGHSERVAFISRWIAEKLVDRGALEESQVHKVYLAGLLHDIGKMGIDESVLRKNGKLTDQEFDFIKTHPSTGAGILNQIKQMREIVPGVLYHHERLDGSGYPEGLAGDKVPVIARIIGLADSFDAMTSDRTYRKAMTVDQALERIEEGLGSQFDEEIGRIFIDSNIYHLWNLMNGDTKEIYGADDSVEYGAMAVGALIR